MEIMQSVRAMQSLESRERETVTSSRSGTGVIPYTNSLTNQSSKHVKWSNFDNEYDLDSDLDLDVTIYNAEKTHSRTTKRVKDLTPDPVDYNSMACIPETAVRSPILSRKNPARSPSPTIDPRSPSPAHQLNVVPPKVAMLRTPSPKDKIEDDHGCKYHSHHLDYVYTPPPVKGPCIGCGLYIIGPLVTALDGMWHPECFTCVNCDSILKGHEYVVEQGKQYCHPCHAKLFGPPCCVCHKPTGENRLDALGRIWHPKCFACVNCGKILSPDNMVERLGSPYCKDCYHNLFSPKCHECQLPIKDKAISALGKMWHPHCFKCCVCHTPLETSNFYEKNGKPYCEKHYHELLPKCAGCKQPITDGTKIVVLGKPWHPKCFCCVECAKPLDPNNFKEHQGKPYCDYDYHRLFSPKCAGCGTPIVDSNKINAMGKPWHPTCFTCCQCAKVLTPPHFKEVNGKAYCLDDYHRLFSPKCAGCSLPITDGLVQGMGKPWHPDCFACAQCEKPLSPTNYLEKNNKPYCDDDYHNKFLPKCSGCQLPISDGNKVQAMGKNWHPNCFNCTQCHKPLSPNNFYEQNGKPYCEDHFHELFSPKCHGCKQPIKDNNFVTAMGKKWHPGCFNCTVCSKKLDPYNFYEEKGKPYCEEDYHNLFSPKCHGCKKPIKDGNFITALGKKWHPQCFNCTTCNRNLDPYNFYEKNGLPYCERDYHNLFSPKCYGCELPITNEANKVNAMGKQWHPPCFNCDKCHKQLDPYNFREKSGKPYCDDCYHKLFSPKCNGCNLPITGPKTVAQGKQWHPECFKCDVCHKPLREDNYFEKGGKVYCEDDYNKLFATKCAGCAQPIKDKSPTIAMGKQWHPACFKCTECSIKLSPDDFMEHNGRPYCRPHYYQLFAPKCHACKQPIVDKIVTALGKQWHPKCFCCCVCHKPLHEDGFREKDGLAYCDEDYHNLFSPKCAACLAPIRDKCLTAMERTWHPEHFTCFHCNKLLSDDPEGYHEMNDKAYCGPCYFELFASKCRGCNKSITDKLCVTALGSNWHPDCFVCRDCGCSLKNGNYFEFEGEPYCEEHYRCKMCPDCIKLRRAQNKYFGKPNANVNLDVDLVNPMIKLGA